MCAKADTTTAASGAMRIGPGSRNRTSPIRVFGSSARASGSIGPCLKRCRCRSTGRSTSATRRPRPTRVLPAGRFPPKRSFIAPLTGRRKVWSGRIRGAMRLPMQLAATSTSQRWDPVAVGSYPGGRSAFGLEDTLGNGWEWTSTPFAPLPWLRALSLLPRLLGGLLRWKAFCGERRFAADCGVHVAALVPQLVPAALSVCLRLVPLCGELKGAAVLIRGGAIQTVNSFADDVRNGLGQTGQKDLPSKYLYDDIGSALFEAITRLPEYGLTRAEERILRKHSRDIAEFLTAHGMVVELGSGSGRKTRQILEALAHHKSMTYCPIEISSAALVSCERELDDLAHVSILGFEAEYLDGLEQGRCTPRTWGRGDGALPGQLHRQLRSRTRRGLSAQDSPDDCARRYIAARHGSGKTAGPTHSLLTTTRWA